MNHSLIVCIYSISFQEESNNTYTRRKHNNTENKTI